MEFLAFLYTVLLVAICLMMALLLYRSAKPAANRDDAERKEWLRQQLEAQNRQMDAKLAEMAQQNLAAMGHISETLQASVQSMSTALAAGQGTQQQTMEQRLQGLEASNARKLEEMRRTLAEGMTALHEIRHTVDEQLQDALQKRVTESFKAVNDQLEQVYKGLGEMQNLAADVGGLKQVLSGVKTRGILGEIQLGAILEEILAPEQYDTNVATIPGSTQRVEYAIRMPGADGGTVWLPIDSKFPGDTYTALCNAYDSGDKVMIEEASKALVVAIKKCAKDIHDKYICPPYTTNFAVMFLPFEGLYAEVVKLGLVEELQRNYGVSIAGPTTMSALLNSLYMGFRTLAVQKRSSEVWKILSSVKKEFENFEDVLTKTKKHLQQVDSDLETLVGVRTRAINKQLMSVGEDSTAQIGTEE